MFLNPPQQLESPEQWTAGTTEMGLRGETEKDTKRHTKKKESVDEWMMTVSAYILLGLRRQTSVLSFPVPTGQFKPFNTKIITHQITHQNNHQYIGFMFSFFFPLVRVQ